jgi:hypothetical protein
MATIQLDSCDDNRDFGRYRVLDYAVDCYHEVSKTEGLQMTQQPTLIGRKSNSALRRTGKFSCAQKTNRLPDGG